MVVTKAQGALQQPPFVAHSSSQGVFVLVAVPKSDEGRKPYTSGFACNCHEQQADEGGRSKSLKQRPLSAYNGTDQANRDKILPICLLSTKGSAVVIHVCYSVKADRLMRV